MIHIRYISQCFLDFLFFFLVSASIQVLVLIVLFLNDFCICQDIPALYLQGGSIIPVGPAIQHVGEANPTDDLSLLVALDEQGNFLQFDAI